MKRFGTDDECKQVAETIAKIGRMTYDEQRRAASLSSDPIVLNVLSTFNDFQIAHNIICNKNAPASALKAIVRNKSSQFVPHLLLRVVRHPNLDVELFNMMAQENDWSVRYAVAMRENAPVEMLRRLASDENLAVRAMAARRLKLPAPDEELNLEVSCEALNETFEKMRAAIGRIHTLSKEAATRIRLGADSLGPFNQFRLNCEMGLEELRDNITYDCAYTILNKHIPDKHVDCGNLPELMKSFGDDYFDAYIIAAKLKVPIAKHRAAIMRTLREHALGLLPRIAAPDRSAGTAIATRPELIQKGDSLLLKVPVRSKRGMPYPDIGTMHELEALDKISKIILAGADPNTVESQIMKRFWPGPYDPPVFGLTPDTTECEIYIDHPILSLRFSPNGGLGVKYLTKEEAGKIADFLMSNPDVQAPDKDPEEIVVEE